MKKSKLAVGLMTAMLCTGVLASCDNVVRYSKEGIVLTYVDGDGVKKTITADDLLKDYYNDSSKYQSIFDQINSIVIRNYFTTDETVTYQGQTLTAGKSDMSQIKIDAQFKVDSDKRTAQTNADNNGTSYSDEFQSILDSKNVEDETELFDYYVGELQKEKFEENFYKYHIEDVKNGATDVKIGETTEDYWKGYFYDMKPYHVSHILVKLEDGSGTNYSNGTVSKENAEKLYEVVNALKSGEDSFGTLAKQFSEDTGSAKTYGDLGIMDYSTGYVNEFKLGVYAYENLFSKKAAGDKVIGIPADCGYEAVATASFGSSFPSIPFSVFKEMKDYAGKVKDENEKAVLDDSANFYPRNIIYNKYLNRHSIAFITGEAGEELPTDTTKTTGFWKYGSEIPGLEGKIVLSVKVAGAWTPILAARAGSDYQGIHFIVIDRSPFTATDGNGVSLSDYYTTYYPEQEGYPKKDGAILKTYVNFSSQSPDDTKTRATDFKSKLKSFDSDKLNKYIFKKYFKSQNLKIADADLDKALNKWLDRSLEKKQQETEDTWNKTWNDYVESLRKQNSERTKLVSEACKIGYAHANKKEKLTDVTVDFEGGSGVTLYAAMAAFLTREGHADKIEEYLGTTTNPKNVVDLFKNEGGLCNDGKDHF